MSTEKRLIDANALLEELDKFANPMPKKSGYDFLCGVATAITEIENAPTVDAVEVVHGRWEHLGGDEWCCTECGNVITTEGSWVKPTKKFCDECGTKMDGGDEDV